MKDTLVTAAYTLLLLCLQLAFLFSQGFNMFFLVLFIGLVSFICIAQELSDSSESPERNHHD